MVEQRHIVLRGREIENIDQFDVYVANGGYEGLKKALGMEPAAVIDEVKASNLRGRGGAGFPAGVKWSFIPKNEPNKYVTVNADESETGTFKDREIMETNPHQLIEGAMICAYAIQATAVYIYLRGEFWDVAAKLDAAIADAEKAGFVGENILRLGFLLPDVYASGRGGLYLRRRERPAQQPGRPAGPTACASTFPGTEGWRPL